MTEFDQAAWKARKSCDFFIAEERFHRNAELFLTNSPELKDDISKALTQSLDGIEHSVRK